jgi:nitrous oxide reductase accessory protein NosL
MKRALALLCVLLAGCSADNGCSPLPPRLSQAAADHVAFTLLADHLNSVQTNWTVLVVARTNK